MLANTAIALFLLSSTKGFSLEARPAPKTVFVTGATGMVGKQFVRDCLSLDPDVQIACLVRPKRNGNCQERLLEILQSSETYDPDRVLAVSGDVTKKRLGMSSDDYENLVESVDSVIHLAADIRLTRGEKSKDTNQLACEEIMELALKGTKKPSVHFMSSVASCIRNPSGWVKETLEDIPPTAAFPGGYGEQKYHSERFLAAKGASGDISVNIYRAPFIVDSESVQQLSVPDIVFQVALMTGVLPRFEDYFPINSLEGVSKGLTYQVVRSLQASQTKKTAATTKVFHLTDSRNLNWDEQVKLLAEAGISSRVVPLNEYRSILAGLAEEQSYAGKLLRALPIVEAVAGTRFAYFSTDHLGETLRKGNLNAHVLRGSIGQSAIALASSLMKKQQVTARPR